MFFPDQEENRTPFLMEVEDFFAARESGVIVSGQVKAGNITIGDEVEIVGFSPTAKRAVVVAKDVLFKGNILLQGLTKDDLMRGQVVAIPGTIKPYTRFGAHVIFSATQTHIGPQPFLGIFRSLFHIRRTDIYGTMCLPTGTSILSPGDQMDVWIELQQPIALEIGFSFGIGRLMGSGTVTGLPGL